MKHDSVTGFILARLDEDEAIAKAALDQGRDWIIDPYGSGPESWQITGWTVEQTEMENDPAGCVAPIDTTEKRYATHVARHHPNRVLAEVAAKRAIVNEFRAVVAGSPFARRAHESSFRGYRAVWLIAAIWAAHPDFPAHAE